MLDGMNRLIAYRFPPGAEFDGRLLGMLERVDSGGPLRILDLLFVALEPETGEPVALTGRGRGEGSLVARMIGFRLDAAERERATARAKRTYEDDVVARLAAALPPGGAIAALLVEPAWVDAVGEVVERCGGSQLLDETVASTTLAERAPRLVAAVVETG
jgi:hypothetical protein